MKVEQVVSALLEHKMLGFRAIAVEADVLDRLAVARAFDAAEQAFGTVTILVNNAGVAHAGRAVEVSEPDWRRVLAPRGTPRAARRRQQ